jgi:hypothetical protein
MIRASVQTDHGKMGPAKLRAHSPKISDSQPCSPISTTLKSQQALKRSAKVSSSLIEVIPVNEIPKDGKKQSMVETKCEPKAIDKKVKPTKKVNGRKQPVQPRPDKIISRIIDDDPFRRRTNPNIQSSQVPSVEWSQPAATSL